MEHGNRAGARRDHGAIGEPNPLALVLTEELVADSPVRGLVLAPVGVDVSSDLGVTTGLASPSFPYFAVEPLVFLRHVEVPEGIPLAIEVGGS